MQEICGRGQSELFGGKNFATGVHLFGQCSHLRHIPRILEHHYVLRVQTDGATVLVFWKQVLHEIYDGCITMVALFVKWFVTRPSVSAMRSSSTTMLRLLASKEVGSPSSRCKLGMSRFSYADCHSRNTT